jgi:hypothetical protein
MKGLVMARGINILMITPDILSMSIICRKSLERPFLLSGTEGAEKALQDRMRSSGRNVLKKKMSNEPA